MTSPDERRLAAWLEVRSLLELQLAPLGARAITALAPQPGERILDVGCGGGETTVQLAHAVGAAGRVVGIDISEAVLSHALPAPAGLAMSYIAADAAIYPFEPRSFDAIFSRFGVMFFADPVAAFANARATLVPGGRLVFICWRTLAESELDALPLAAAAPFLPAQAPEPPSRPGAFSFADPDHIRHVLARAGFVDVTLTKHDTSVSSGGIEEMVAVVTRLGALGRLLREEPERRPSITPAVRQALADRATKDGVALTAATWLVTARRG